MTKDEYIIFINKAIASKNELVVIAEKKGLEFAIPIFIKDLITFRRNFVINFDSNLCERLRDYKIIKIVTMDQYIKEKRYRLK